MIYLDNAATTMRKPPQVVQAVVKALESIGNAGRGAYHASLDASRIIYDTRVKLVEFFGGDHAEQVAFTANSTESLNLAIKGLFYPGDHITQRHWNITRFCVPCMKWKKKEQN